MTFAQVEATRTRKDLKEIVTAPEDYRVDLYRWVGQIGGPGSLFGRGSATFTP